MSTFCLHKELKQIIMFMVMNLFLISGVVTEVNNELGKTANIEILTKSGIHKVYYKKGYSFKEKDKIIAFGTIVPYQIYSLMYASTIIKLPFKKKSLD